MRNTCEHQASNSASSCPSCSGWHPAVRRAVGQLRVTQSLAARQADAQRSVRPLDRALCVQGTQLELSLAAPALRCGSGLLWQGTAQHGTAGPARSPSGLPARPRAQPGCTRRGEPRQGRDGQGGAGTGRAKEVRPGPAMAAGTLPAPLRGSSPPAARQGEKAAEEKRWPCPPSQQSSPTKGAPAGSREAPHAQRARRAAPAQRTLRAR